MYQDWFFPDLVIDNIPNNCTSSFFNKNVASASQRLLELEPMGSISAGSSRFMFSRLKKFKQKETTNHSPQPDQEPPTRRGANLRWFLKSHDFDDTIFFCICGNTRGPICVVFEIFLINQLINRLSCQLYEQIIY